MSPMPNVKAGYIIKERKLRKSLMKWKCFLRNFITRPESLLVEPFVVYPFENNKNQFG